MSSIITQEFRSAQGVHRAIQNCCGVQVILHDEAHHFFAQMAQSQESYMRSIKPMLLKLYSAYDNPQFDPGQVVSTQGQLSPLLYPSVSYCGFGVPECLEDAFSDLSLVEGFLTRFIVLQEQSKDVQALTSGRPHAPTQFDFEHTPAWLSLMERVQLASVSRKACENQPQALEFEQIRWAKPALAAILAFSEKIAAQRNADAVDDILFSRAVETVIRLCGALAEREITLECVEFSITLVTQLLGFTRSKMQHTMSSAAFVQGEYVLEKLRAHEQSTSKSPSARDLLKACRKITSTKQLTQVLKDLIEDGQVTAIKASKTGPGPGRPTMRYATTSLAESSAA